MKKKSPMYLIHTHGFVFFDSRNEFSTLKIYFYKFIIDKNTCIRRDKFSCYGSTKNLLFNTWIKLRVVVLQYKISRIN